MLGGLTGSSLADLLEQGGGPPNEWSGMRERENRAPPFPFLPVGEAQPPPPVNSFHPNARRLMDEDDKAQEEAYYQQRASDSNLSATQSNDEFEQPSSVLWAPLRWRGDSSAIGSSSSSSEHASIDTSSRSSSSGTSTSSSSVTKRGKTNNSQSALRSRRLGGGAFKDKHLLGNEDETNKGCKYVPWKMKVVCPETSSALLEGSILDASTSVSSGGPGNKRWKEKKFSSAGTAAAAAASGDGDDIGGGSGSSPEGGGKQRSNRLSDEELLASKVNAHALNVIFG